MKVSIFKMPKPKSSEERDELKKIAVYIREIYQDTDTKPLIISSEIEVLDKYDSTIDDLVKSVEELTKYLRENGIKISGNL
jgi:hypothetical protein